MRRVLTINEKGLKCKLYKVRDKIYAVSVPDDYERALLFMRYQEYYESPFKSIRRKPIDIGVFMLEYAKNMKKGGFTYLTDWYGYNIPSDVLLTCWTNVCLHSNVTGKNFYDVMMDRIIRTIIIEEGKGMPKFYLLGVDSVVGSETMNHELAHGLFYTSAEYNDEIMKLYNALPKTVRLGMSKILKKIGYIDSVVPDETQAYFSTGMYKEMSKYKKYAKPFQEFFTNFIKIDGKKKATKKIERKTK